MSTIRGGARGDLYDQLVREDRVHRRLYTDAEIFAEEMLKVFGVSWVYVGHASELTSANDFKTGTLGGRPIIVTRDADGEFHVLLNRCLHRGATVCRVERGRAKRFVCPYHGWAYANNGALTGVPWPSGYAPDFDTAALSLGRAKVAVYRDFIFATFNPDPVPIEEHLGAARRSSTPGSTGSQAARSSRAAARTAWTARPTGSSSPTTRPTAITRRSRTARCCRWRSGWGRARTWRTSPTARTTAPCTASYLGNGHSFIDQRPMYEAAGSTSGTAASRAGPGGAGGERSASATSRRRRRACSTSASASQMNLTIFPNLLIIGNQIQCSSRSRSTARCSLVGDDLAAPARRDQQLRMRSQEDFPSFGEPDDLANFAECQRGLAIPEVEWVLMNRG